MIRHQDDYPPEVEQEFAPEKLPFHPMGKDRLTTTIFQGRTVKLWGCIPFFWGNLGDPPHQPSL